MGVSGQEPSVPRQPLSCGVGYGATARGAGRGRGRQAGPVVEGSVQMPGIGEQTRTRAAVRKALASIPCVLSQDALRHCLSAGCAARLDGRASLWQVLEPWRLSTSQIAQFQIRMFDPNKHPKHLGAGGGFGPVSALEGGQVGGTRGRACLWRVQGLKGVRPEARAQAWTCLAWEQNGYQVLSTNHWARSGLTLTLAQHN